MAFCQETEYDQVFFDNSLMEESWFYSEVSYDEPSFVLNHEKRIPVTSAESFTPGNCLQLNYNSAIGGDWQVKLKFPETRGKDHFVKGDLLSFWLKSNQSIEENALLKISLELKDKGISETLSLANFLKNTTENQWVQVKIPLADFIKGDSEINSTKIKSIVWQQGSSDNAEHHLFIDQVEILKETTSHTSTAPVLLSAKGYDRHVDLVWNKLETDQVHYVRIYRSSDDENFIPVGIQNAKEYNRYTDFTGEANKTYNYKISSLGYDYRESEFSSTVEVHTQEMTDEELLDMVQEACFRYYWDGAEPQSGLALENMPGRKNMIATGASGFGLMAMVVGVDRGFISSNDFIERIKKIMAFIEKGDRFQGALPHFMNGITGKVEPFFGKYDDGADLVETSFFAQGLLTVREYLAENTPEETNLVQRIDAFWEGIEWDWFKQHADSDFLYWHWSPEHKWHINHKLIGWNETLITYFLAIASPTHGISADMYYSGWASQDPVASAYRKNWGKTSDGSQFSNGNSYYGVQLPVGVANGGPLFFTHYSFLGLHPHKIKDKYTDYFTNNQNIALINYRYTVENPKDYEGYGSQSWGLTASDAPWGYRAREPRSVQDDGTIAPTGALASFPYLPEKAMPALKHYYRDYGSFLWGEYGFRDAFNLGEDWTADIFMGLNQAPIVVMIENYRTGLIWDTFMKNADVQRALQKIQAATNQPPTKSSKTYDN